MTDSHSDPPRQPSGQPGDAVTVQAMSDHDWPAVRAVFEAGIATGNSTFETRTPSWERWDAGHLPGHRFVAVSGGDAVRGDDLVIGGDRGVSARQVLGWAALAPVSDRCAYAGVAEDSVYVDPAHHGRGIGRALLQVLVEQSEAAGIWTVQAGIFPENHASIALHQRCGFRIVGRRERLARLRGVWRDVLLLERRSPNIT